MGALAGFVFMLLVLAAIVTTGLLLNRRRIRTQNDAFRRLASDHNGTALMAGVFDKPSARFNHDVDIVECPSCRTPHHADCWDYFGSCSTFGCGQTRCRRVTRLPFFPKGT